MDSRQQDDKSGVLKHLLSLLLVGTLVILSGSINELYIYGGGKDISCVNIDSTTNESFTSPIYEGDTNKYDDNKLNNNQLSSKAINTTLLVSKNTNIQNNISNLNLMVNGYAIAIDDNAFGYVSSSEQRDVIVEEVCKQYIDTLGIDIKDVSRVEVNGKIEATPEKVMVSQLSNSGEISKEIYSAAIINDDLLDVKISVKVEDKQVLEPEVIVNEDSDIYMGEELIEQGENGSILVYKEITYEGLTQTSEKLIDKKILVDSTPTIIKKGIKNPYPDGVAFLARPTSGGYLTSYFGEVRATSTHKGIDIAKNTGDDVNAAFDGKVIYSGYNDGGYGNLIIIEHDNNMKTYYAHLSKIFVNLGEYVKKEEVIGAVGSTGLSTGPHLHFELRVDDVAVNPLNYIVE